MAAPPEQNPWFSMDLRLGRGKHSFRLKILGGFGFVSTIVAIAAIVFGQGRALDVLQLLLERG